MHRKHRNPHIHDIHIQPGDTLLTPAAGQLHFEGEGVLLKGWAPGRARLAAYLRSLGQQELSAVAQLV